MMSSLFLTIHSSVLLSFLFLTKGYPAEFSTYLSYCRSLRFEEKPNYAYLQDLLKQLFYRERFLNVDQHLVVDHATEHRQQVPWNLFLTQHYHLHI